MATKLSIPLEFGAAPNRPSGDTLVQEAFRVAGGEALQRAALEALAERLPAE